MSLSVERPRETSKSAPNNGCFGTRASAAAISFCSSAEGVHTFSMLTFTCGWVRLQALLGRLLRRNLLRRRQRENTDPEVENQNSGHGGILNEKALNSKSQTSEVRGTPPRTS